MSETKQITNFEELRKLRLADDGYIVITDSARPTIVHRLNSKCIRIDSFNTKVGLNAGKQGAYYWVDSISTAAKLYGANRCKICKPELFLVQPSDFS